MTLTHIISKSRIALLLASLFAAFSVALATDKAEAASPSTVTATCYSDGYITISDGGNVASAPQHLRLRIAYRTSSGWRWQTYQWRAVDGSSFRLNATRGAQYHIHATIATANGSGGFTYQSDFVSVTNVNVSPIGAVTVESRTKGLCKT